MRTVVLEAPCTLKLVDQPLTEKPARGQARVRTLRVGVCGTDLHAYNGNQPMMRYPVILGHEMAVEVIELAPGTEQSAANPGDRCTVLPYVSCGHCITCRRGKENACTQLEVLGVHRDGGLCDQFDLPAHLLIPANDLPTDSLALVEMLAIGEHATARAAITADDTVLVLGAGPIGLGAIAAAKLRADRVLAVDLNEERLAFLGALGIAEVVSVPDPAKLAGRLRDMLGGDLPTVIMDATGNANSMSSALSLAAPGGRLVFIGHTKQVLGIDNPTLHRGELTLLASRNATRHDFENVLAHLRSGAIDVAPWITTRVDPAGLVRDLPRWAGGPSEVVKAVVEFT